MESKARFLGHPIHPMLIVFPPVELPTVAFVVELCGLALVAVTGWLGGELVDRLGVGVSPGAHLNAPSSLDSGAALPEAHPRAPAHGEHA